MQKIFRVRMNDKITGFMSFGGSSKDRRKAARAHQNEHNKYWTDCKLSVQRVRGATSTVPVKHYINA